MRKYFRLLFWVILICILSISCMQAKEPQQGAGSLAPDFKLQDLAQQAFSLASYKDRQPVVLFFWTTWCPFCRQELRALNDKYPELLKEGFELFAINSGESANTVENFLKKNPITFKVLLDKDGSVSSSYELLGVPTYFLIDKSGSIRDSQHKFPDEAIKEIISG